MWMIKDWTGKLMSYGEFETAEDAFEFLANKFQTDEELSEYTVFQVGKE